MRFLGLTYIDGYFQSWGFASRLRGIPLIGKYVYRFIQWSCSKITGHEASKTEWGYGSGPNADVWCRWCNQIGEIPKGELGQRFANARAIIWRITGCDINRGG